MYWRLELITQIDRLIFKAENILRPTGTVLRPGDEVLCVQQNNLLLWGKPISHLDFSLA